MTHLVCQKDHNCINTQSLNGKRQALFCYELCKQLAASVLGRLFRLSELHITGSSAIVDHLGASVGKKNLEITKMTDHFSHTKKGFRNCQS